MIKVDNIGSRNGHKLFFVKRGVVLVVLAFVSAVLSVTAGADAEADVEDGPRDPSVSFYAQDYGVDLEEAELRLNRLEGMQDLISEVRLLEAARVAGWGIDHQGRFVAWVLLTGETPPSDAAAKVAADNADFEIRTGASYSLKELLAGQQALIRSGATGQVDEMPKPSSPLDQLDEMISFTGISMANNAVRVGVRPPKVASDPLGRADDSVNPKEGVEIAMKRADQLLKQILNVSYQIEVAAKSSLAATFAGGQNTDSGCTTGFAAQDNATQAYRIITAGHCGGSSPNNIGSLRVNDIWLPHIRGYAHQNVDAQFHGLPSGSSHSVIDDYLCNKSYLETFCDVSSTVGRNDMQNRYVCHTGMNSGISCGTVNDIQHQPRYEDPECYLPNNTRVRCAAAFVEVTGDFIRGCRGDSGGPWYWRGAAYGIHVSSPDENPCTALGGSHSFSPIDAVEDFLNVRVLTIEPRNMP